MNKKRLLILLLTMMLISCNLPTAVSNPPVQGGPVQILSPQSGANLSAGAVTVQFTATGGPFIEANLYVDDVFVATVAQDGTSESISGTIVWDNPTGGAHTLTIEVLTPNKELFSASAQVTIEGGAGEDASAGQTPLAQPTQDAGLEAARQRVIQILLDEYGISMTNPPVGQKARGGVFTDPWTSAIYYQDWFIHVSIYPDGREVHYAYPLNDSVPDPASTFIEKPGDKPIPMCRPSGTIKLLVVFVNYQNLGVTQQESLDALAQTVDQINGRYVEASQAVGLQTPILQIQATGAYLSSPPAMTDHLLNPELVRTSTGIDPAESDLLVQIDLDANDSSGVIGEFGSYGFATSGCGALPNDVNIWIAISKKEQLSQTGSDRRMQSTLGHEILHTMGYPIGLTGLHEWICGDGSLLDPTDQCDQNILPTLMLWWAKLGGFALGWGRIKQG